MVAYGNGKHIARLTKEEQEGVAFWTTIAFCTGIMTLSIPKLAVVSLLVRILNPGRFHKWFLWGIVIWCQISFIAAIGLLLGRCTPLHSLWDFSVKGSCFDVNALVSYGIYASGETNSLEQNVRIHANYLGVKSTRLSSTSISLFIQLLSSFTWRYPSKRTLLLPLLSVAVLCGRRLRWPLLSGLV